jgi:hypothetical protein
MKTAIRNLPVEPKALQHVHGVGADLNSRADACEFPGLFEYVNIHAAARKACCERKPAHSRPDDANF